MTTKIECDWCGGNIPLETNIQKVKIGETEVGDGCVTCASNITNALKLEISNNAKARMEAAAAAATPPPETPAETQPGDDAK